MKQTLIVRFYIYHRIPHIYLHWLTVISPLGMTFIISTGESIRLAFDKWLIIKSKVTISVLQCSCDRQVQHALINNHSRLNSKHVSLLTHRSESSATLTPILITCLLPREINTPFLYNRVAYLLYRQLDPQLHRSITWWLHVLLIDHREEHLEKNLQLQSPKKKRKTPPGRYVTHHARHITPYTKEKKEEAKSNT